MLQTQPTSEKHIEELMIQARTEAIHIIDKYKIQIEPIQFE